MIEGFWYGLVASLSFIGLISTIYFFILHILKNDNNTQFFININEDITAEDIRKLICKWNLLNLLLTDFKNEIVLVYDHSCDIRLVNEIAEDYSDILILNINELTDYIQRKEIHGTGVY